MKTYIIAEIGINHNGDIMNALKLIDIAYLASKGVIKLRYDLKSISNKANLKFLHNLKDNFSEDILAFENIPLYTIIGNLLKEKNLTLSIVESVTGGKITSKITQVPGISNHLISSDIVYTNFAKSKFETLKIPAKPAKAAA